MLPEFQHSKDFNPLWLEATFSGVGRWHLGRQQMPRVVHNNKLKRSFDQGERPNF